MRAYGNAACAQRVDACVSRIGFPRVRLWVSLTITFPLGAIPTTRVRGRASQIGWPSSRDRRDRAQFAHPEAEPTVSSARDTAVAVDRSEIESELERHRTSLTGYCYRMLGSPFEAEDAVQETFLRAWCGYERFEGRAAVSSWLYRIATNVCIDLLKGRERRAMPMDLGPAQAPLETNLRIRLDVTWIQPIPSTTLIAEADPADVAVAHETIRLAFVAALQYLPPRQRAVLILRDVLCLRANEVADILDTSVTSISSALQRARTTITAAGLDADDMATTTDAPRRELLARYVRAFETYDLDALTTLIQHDAKQSMPPYDLWLSGRDDVLAWWFGPGVVCRGSRLLPTRGANGSVAFGQYKPSASGRGFDPWALQVLEWKDGAVAEFAFFLDTEHLFPLFGLPSRLDPDPEA
jgi:RNA polymerase sigma-70 factor, ECF subfamily